MKSKLPERNKKGNRTGFTTGACAAASAKAAVRFLITNKKLDKIESILPNKDKVVFALNRCERNNDEAITSIIKDAGDDPDCTHGAEITTTVKLTHKDGVLLKNGKGIGTITKPGLGLDIGVPSITPIPRKNITNMVLQELVNTADYSGAEITISVDDGEDRAKQTTNARLGIVGGISILGTTGIVRPYSTAAFRASVVQEINVAMHQGLKDVALTTGGKSEEFAKKQLSNLKDECFIQVGDFIGVGLKTAVKDKMERVHIVGMVGKLSKMASGTMQTHVAGSKVDMSFLAQLAQEAGATEQHRDQIMEQTTARFVLELAEKEGFGRITDIICQKVSAVAQNHVNGAIKAHTYLFDFGGNLLSKT